MAEQPQPYSEKVMEHFQNPRNVGEIPDASGIGTVGNAVCGDVMKMYLKIENNIITDAKFKTFGCLPSQEKVVLSEGGWEDASRIDKGMKIVNSLGRETLVGSLYERNYAGRMLTFIPFVSPFNTFKVTPEHPLLCIKREWIKGARKNSSKSGWLRFQEQNLFESEPDFVKAREIKEGDYLVFSVNKEVKDNDAFSNKIMRLIGYYLSEGYISAGGSVVAFAFNKKEKGFIKEVKFLLEDIVGKNPKSRIRDNVEEVYTCSRKLARFLVLHCNKIASKKSLSKEILLLPFAKQWEMVKTYLNGDGDYYRRRKGNSKTYRIITTSESLAIQIQEILARGGIFVSVRKIHKTDCRINGRKLRDSIQYVISFKLVRQNKFVYSNSKHFFVPVKKIEANDFRGRVYNFHVLGEPNSYLVKGFAVHNCGAAVATSSMVTEMVKGKTIEEALSISNKAVAEALGGLPPVKMHCSVLAEEALRSALADYYKKQGKEPPFDMKSHAHDEHGH